MNSIKTKYNIVFLIKDEADKYQQKLIKKIGPKFDENRIFDNKELSHCTLKAPFFRDNITNIENIIKQFVKKYSPSKVTFGDFGNFENKVIFTKVKFDKYGLKIQKDLIKEFQKLKNIEIRERDLKNNPHATISFCSSNNSFKKMWEHLKKLDKKIFNINFDNITILKRTDKYWKVHKSYSIK